MLSAVLLTSPRRRLLDISLSVGRRADSGFLKCTFGSLLILLSNNSGQNVFQRKRMQLLLSVKKMQLATRETQKSPACESCWTHGAQSENLHTATISVYDVCRHESMIWLTDLV